MEQHLLGEPLGNTTRLEVLEGPTGRRSWSDDVKGRIVAESFEPGARVVDVARRHGTGTASRRNSSLYLVAIHCLLHSKLARKRPELNRDKTIVAEALLVPDFLLIFTP